MSELKALCNKWLVKAFNLGLKSDPFDANNSEFNLPMIDFKWSKEMAEEISRAPLTEDVVEEIMGDIEKRAENNEIDVRNWRVFDAVLREILMQLVKGKEDE